MNVTYRCPSCEQTVRSAFTAESADLVCPACTHKLTIPSDAVSNERIDRCLVCPSTDLFARKDFPQKLGVGLVVFGFVASSIAWANYQVFWTFAILFATALVDLVLYLVMGRAGRGCVLRLRERDRSILWQRQPEPKQSSVRT
jgi:DNA-directed RNA polymerase subunit RPC12/RpoP